MNPFSRLREKVAEGRMMVIEMAFYSLLRPLLFQLNPETAHHWTLQSLALAQRCGWRQRVPTTPNARRQIMGLDFPNPVGLAAGLDKNGDYINALAALGFGFIEIGTVTPRPQTGNPQPRLFRLPQAQALINRMGFNNLGVDHLVDRVQKAQFHGILGINIGKNFDTPLNNALDDYLCCLDRVYALASYVVINISSPNTPQLRELQHAQALQALIIALQQKRAELANQQQKYVPLVIKISPDLNANELTQLAQVCLEHEIDGIIATNTTLSRQGVAQLHEGNQAGGLSGKPLFSKSHWVVSTLYQQLQGKIPIIACGGIMTAADAQAMLQAGASLVQLYTGLIYGGPALVGECARI